MTTHTNKCIISKGRAAAAGVTTTTTTTVLTTNCALLNYRIGGGMLYAKMD
jgi:hypothetical protein